MTENKDMSRCGDDYVSYTILNAGLEVITKSIMEVEKER